MRTISRPALALLGTFACVTVITTEAAAARTAVQPATPRVKESRPGLLRQARITADAATRTAMQQVPNGTIREVEIEQEHGRLVYSYDIKVSDKAGIEEVLIDAKTGVVVSHTHESAAVEAAEARQDARGSQKTKSVKRSTSSPTSDRDR